MPKRRPPLVLRPALHPLLRAWLLLAPLTVGIFALPVHANALDNLRTDDIGLNKIPHLGTSNILVIAMRVGSPYTTDAWQQLQTEYATEGGPDSFRDFWRSQSGGRYDPIPYLMPAVIYPECPLPDLGTNCNINTDNFNALINGDIRDLLREVFERVRDENQIDLAMFDKNAAGCALGEDCADGFFDGVILMTTMFDGIAFPLAALGNVLVVETTPRPIVSPPDGGLALDAGALLDGGGSLDAGAVDGGGAGNGGVDAGPQGPTLTCGIIALAPPRDHEYGHTLGFIDQYGGPSMSGLMSEEASGLAAYNRLSLSWADVVDVDGPETFQLEPVLNGGSILRFGAPPRYVLVENRSGPDHVEWDDAYPGIYLYSVDEDQLPTTAIGFFSPLEGTLYLPNQNPPYLNVNIPLECNQGPPGTLNVCVMAEEGNLRDIEHTLEGQLGFHVAFISQASDGTVQLEVRGGTRADPTDPVEPDPTPDAGDPEPDPMPEPAVDAGPGDGDGMDDCGCGATGTASWPLAILGLGLLSVRRRRPGLDQSRPVPSRPVPSRPGC